MLTTADLLRSTNRQQNLQGLRQVQDVHLVPLIRKFVKKGSLRTEAALAIYRCIVSHLLETRVRTPEWRWEYYMRQLVNFVPDYPKRIFDDLMMEPLLKRKLAYLGILMHMGDNAIHRRMLFMIQKNTDAKFRASAVRYLGPRIDQKIFLEILKFLEDKDLRVVANAIEAVGERGDYRLENICQTFRNNQNNRIKGNALLSLWRLGHQDVSKDLREMIGHESAYMRATALWVLGEIGHTSVFDVPNLVLQCKMDQSEMVKKRFRKTCQKLSIKP